MSSTTRRDGTCWLCGKQYIRAPATALSPALRSPDGLVPGSLVDQGFVTVFPKAPDSECFQLCGVRRKDCGTVAAFCHCHAKEATPLQLVTQFCLILCNPLDCSWPGPSVHGIIQARKEAMEDTEMTVTAPRKTLLIKSGDVLGLVLSHRLLPLVGKKCNLVLIYIFLARWVKVSIFLLFIQLNWAPCWYWGYSSNQIIFESSRVIIWVEE